MFRISEREILINSLKYLRACQMIYDIIFYALFYQIHKQNSLAWVRTDVIYEQLFHNNFNDMTPMTNANNFHSRESLA
jgi:hypothetical protein